MITTVYFFVFDTNDPLAAFFQDFASVSNERLRGKSVQMAGLFHAVRQFLLQRFRLRSQSADGFPSF